MIKEQVLEPLIGTLGSGEIDRVVGYLSVRLDVRQDGTVSNVVSVCNTLVDDPDDFSGVVGYNEEDWPVTEDASADVRLTVFEALKNLHFIAVLPVSKMTGETSNNNITIENANSVIVPFAFE